jgi:hypothetical protein
MSTMSDSFFEDGGPLDLYPGIGSRDSTGLEYALAPSF